MEIISQIADILKPVSNEVFSGKGKLCLSANYLEKLNKAIDANITEDINSSFHILQTSTLKLNLLRDVQFLLELIERTVCLKISVDVPSDFSMIDITKFKNLKVLEIHHLDIALLIGLQKLRSQLQELSCIHSIKCLSDVLDKCGGDNSCRYNWNELRKADFSCNAIMELDESLECALSLQTLDLSHNSLTKVNFFHQLPNLKYLNLSYNKLENAPCFQGQIKNRLQVLLLNNNFIEDISGLTSINNLVQLDMSYNCLLDHKCLLAVSHLISLQWLGLLGNPISFHPHHRTLACNYLNKNAATLKFSLDGILLNKLEQSLVGSLYPIFQVQTHQGNNLSNNSLNSSTISIQEKPRKVRNAKISNEDEVAQKIVPSSTPTATNQHLEIKRQLEKLRQEYGEKWLFRDSGLLVQDVLGFEKSLVLSSTPVESATDSLYMANSHSPGLNANNTVINDSARTEGEDSFQTEEFKSAINESFVYKSSEVEDDSSGISDGEDIFSGEECIFLVTEKNSGNQVFVVLTENHVSERDVTNSKEKARWHINTIITCTKLEDLEYIIKIEFDTLRRDRKQRIYQLDSEEFDKFYKSISKKIDAHKTEEQKINYQCMKCSEVFFKQTNKSIKEESVVCPKCGSNMIVEST